MPNFAWLGEEENLTAEALTLRAQTIPDDDDGTLLWPTLFPRVPVDKLEFRTIGSVDFRPASDRREWNTRGRFIPIVMPGTRKIEWVPVEGYVKFDEQEINELLAQVRGNEQLFRQIIGASLPQRVDAVARANLRRIEVDAFTAWILRSVTQRNPQTGASTTITLATDSARYETASTPWASATSAYAEFLAWLEDVIQDIGPIAGAMMPRAIGKEIQADAPQGVNAVPLTLVQVEDRISQDLGSAFQFFFNDRTVDIFDDGGIAYTRTRVFSSQHVAAVPADGRIGETQFAPVARAYDLIGAAGETSGIDIRGQTLYYETSNAGRELTAEIQVNPFTVPTESRVRVIDVV